MAADGGRATHMITRLRSSLGIGLALTPFVLFIVLFEVIPVVILLLGSIGWLDHPTLKYLTAVFAHPVYSKSVTNTLLVSAISGVIGAIVGTAIGYALTATRHDRLRGALVALANVTANS